MRATLPPAVPRRVAPSGDYTWKGPATSRRKVDPDRLRSFVATDYPRVVAVVAVLCGDDGLAEDSVQEALARACEQERRGRHIDNLAAWVTTVASNETRSVFRRRGREQRALARHGPRLDPVPDPATTADELAIRDAVGALPRRQRQAVALRYFLGLDLAEIGRTLGIAEGTVKALLFQARRRLGDALDDTAAAPPADGPAEASRRRRLGAPLNEIGEVT
ncbi:MAG: RNA polymerase sigma factor [Microthrixaceae bacterium]